MSGWRRSAEIVLASLAVWMLSSKILSSCPLCNRRETCFTTDVERSEIAVIGRTNASSSFRPVAAVKGGEHLDGNSITGIELPANKNLILFGRLQPDGNSESNVIEWFHQYSISIYGMDYLRRFNTMSASADRLASFLPYLNSPDPSVADDAFYQIARAEYSAFKKLQDHLDRGFVVDLFSDPSSVSEVQTLALRMLALCGSSDDAGYPLKWINQSDVHNLRGIDVAISCYLSLRKQAALTDLEERFISQPSLPHSVKVAIIRALQFHLRFEDQIDQPLLLSALRKFATDPDVFDLVLPDLIQMKDWSVLDDVAEVFKANQQRLVRVVAAEYLLACPNQAAEKLLAELRNIDSDAVTQAETGKTVFTDVPKSTNEASFLTAILASRFASPAVLTTIIAISIVSVVIFSLKRLRR